MHRDVEADGRWIPIRRRHRPSPSPSFSNMHTLDHPEHAALRLYGHDDAATATVPASRIAAHSTVSQLKHMSFTPRAQESCATCIAKHHPLCPLCPLRLFHGARKSSYHVLVPGPDGWH